METEKKAFELSDTDLIPPEVLLMLLSMMWAPHAAIRNVWILNIWTEFNFINLEHGWYET